MLRDYRTLRLLFLKFLRTCSNPEKISKGPFARFGLAKKAFGPYTRFGLAHSKGPVALTQGLVWPKNEGLALIQGLVWLIIKGLLP